MVAARPCVVSPVHFLRIFYVEKKIRSDLLFVVDNNNARSLLLMSSFVTAGFTVTFLLYYKIHVIIISLKLILASCWQSHIFKSFCTGRANSRVQTYFGGRWWCRKDDIRQTSLDRRVREEVRCYIGCWSPPSHLSYQPWSYEVQCLGYCRTRSKFPNNNNNKQQYYFIFIVMMHC